MCGGARHWPLAHQRARLVTTATPQHLSLVLWAAAALRRQDDALIRAVSARWSRRALAFTGSKQVQEHG